MSAPQDTSSQHSQGSSGKLYLLAGAALTLCLVILTFVVAHALNVAPSAQGTQPVQASGTPMVTGAVLGGRWSDFNKRFGPQLNQETDVWIGTVKGQRVQVQIFQADQVDVIDGGQRANAILLSVPSGSSPWSEATATALVESFLPSDAQYGGDVQAANGTEHVYVSALLANTFKSSVFTLHGGSGRMPAGTFDWQCAPPASGSTGYSTCSISTGQR